MRRLAILLALLTLAPALAGSATAAPGGNGGPAGVPAGTPDPTLAGPLATARSDYDFGWTFVDDPSLLVYAYPVHVRGEVTYPTTGTDWPLLVLMHGRHGTCDLIITEGIATPCPDMGIIGPVPSHEGYRYLADNLASHGYVVASIDANDVNDKDLAGDGGAVARAELLLDTLDAFEAVDAGTDASLPALTGRIDMDNVGVMGHSRGGMGVATAVDLNAARPAAERHALKAVFALAPTAFDRPTVAGVAYGTLLPYCDNDVYDLEGAWIYDDTRYIPGAGPLHQFLAMGAVHNFYNTVWTYDDDGGSGDPWCDASEATNGRDSPVQQREHGLAVMAAFLRAYAGGETAFLPLLTGAEDWNVASTVHTSYHAPAADRFTIDDGTAAWTTTGMSRDARCTGTDCRSYEAYGTATRIEWAFSGAASATTTFAADFSGFDQLTFRLGVDLRTGSAAPAVTVTLTDGSGTSDTVTVVDDAVHFPPGDDYGETVSNMAAVDLADFAVDLTDVDAVTLGFTGTNQVMIVDVQAQSL